MCYSFFSCYPQVLSTVNKSNVEMALTFQLVTSLFLWARLFWMWLEELQIIYQLCNCCLEKTKKEEKKKKEEKAQYKLPVIRFVSKCESVFVISQSEFSKIAVTVLLKRKLCLYPRHRSSTGSESQYILMTSNIAFGGLQRGGFSTIITNEVIWESNSGIKQVSRGRLVSQAELFFYGLCQLGLALLWEHRGHATTWLCPAVPMQLEPRAGVQEKGSKLLVTIPR